MNKFKPVRINKENGLAFRPYIVAEYFAGLLKKNNYGLGLLTEDGLAAGAIACTHEGAALTLNSIFVDEGVRGQGGGTLLVGLAKTLAQKLDAVLRVCYAYPGQREMEAFFRKQGFAGPDTGNTIFSVSFEAIGASTFINRDFGRADKFIPFHEAPPGAVLDYRARVGKDIPSFAAVEKAQGALVPEATLAHLREGRICSFIVSTVLDDGSFYLNSLYMEKADTPSLPALIQAALRALYAKSGGTGRLYIAAHNDAGLSLTSHLLREAPPEAVETQQIRSMVYVPAYERRIMDMASLDYVDPALDMLLPKLSGLSEMMTGLGIENVLIVRLEAASYVSVAAGSGGGADFPEIRLSYAPSDTGSAGQYVLTAFAALPLPESGDISGIALCEDFNAVTLGPFAYGALFDNVIFLRSNLPEKEFPVSEGVFGYFWELFLAGISGMKALIGEAADS
ncbi:MAG: GNAT family N-acetyltransferase [Gracilibacteraceae bacterium]|jgi:GNAT superfamily N-acetyltransferase|nr:GNAT family N-acetyltransferase [Gracilibacteraceae bacterium]